MEKVLKFIDSLKSPLYDLLGYPTVKCYPEFCEVIFKTDKVLRDLEVLDLSSDEFRMYADDNGNLCIVFTFYKS